MPLEWLPLLEEVKSPREEYDAALGPEGGGAKGASKLAV